MKIGPKAGHLVAMAVVVAAGACRGRAAEAPERASGYVEATDVRVAPAGRRPTDGGRRG